jgi:Icc-related predicted phosphoesterase
MTHRIFFAVDVHGSTIVWRKWLSAVQFYGANTLMLCGDLTGKMLVPLIKQNDGSYLVSFFKSKFTLKTGDEYNKMMQRLENSGNYPFVATMVDIEEMRKDKEKVDSMMNRAIVDRMEQWLTLALEKIDTKKIQLVVMPGNDDIPQIDDVIRGYEDRGLTSALERVVDIGGIETISLAHVNPSPWDTPRELSEEELGKRIDGLVSRLQNPKKGMFNFHCPPYNTKLDLAPKLDKTLKPVTEGGAVVFDHVGSTSVRKAIQEYQPQIGMHGHIHESGDFDKIGGTPVINPGSEYGEGILRGIIVEIEDKKVTKFWRVEG